MRSTKLIIAFINTKCSILVPTTSCFNVTKKYVQKMFSLCLLFEYVVNFGKATNII